MRKTTCPACGRTFTGDACYHGRPAGQPTPKRDDRYEPTHPRHRELMLPCCAAGEHEQPKKTYAAPLNSQTGEFEIHAADCRDLAQPRKVRDYNMVPGEKPHTVEAVSADAAAFAVLAEEFSDESEHPAADGFPGGSFGAAGFTARVYPCAKAKVAPAAAQAPAVEPTSLWSQSDREHHAFRLMEEDTSAFAHALARLWFSADATNKAKIRAAWGQTIEEFAQRAAKVAR